LAADQETTEEWWETKRQDYQLFVSEVVLDEAAEGDPTWAAKRTVALAGIPRLAFTASAEALIKHLLGTEIIPAKAAPDAAHIALAAAHGVDFLLTWNCRHIHNLKLERRIESACRMFGLVCPIICTPAELMEI
jgi:hypothetical protein